MFSLEGEGLSFSLDLLYEGLAPPDLNLVQALPVDPGLPAAPLLSARPCIALSSSCVFGNGNFYGSAWPIFQIDSESQWE